MVKLTLKYVGRHAATALAIAPSLRGSLGALLQRDNDNGDNRKRSRDAVQQFSVDDGIGWNHQNKSR